MAEKMITVQTPKCRLPGCRLRTGTVRVPEAGFKAWRKGALIQDVLPGLSPDQREMLISGTHPACWKRVFGDG